MQSKTKSRVFWMVTRVLLCSEFYSVNMVGFIFPNHFIILTVQSLKNDISFTDLSHMAMTLAQTCNKIDVYYIIPNIIYIIID